MKILATNKKAYHDYEVIDKFEAGINLIGCEVKSIRKGEINLKDSYVSVSEQLMLIGCHIKNYDKGSYANLDPFRPRRLLMQSQQIKRLRSKVIEKGYTVIPLSVYLSGSLVKIEIALCRGKQTYDKKKAIAEKDAKRDLEIQLKSVSRK